MQFYSKNVNDVIKELYSDKDNGLNEIEVEDRYKKYGYNVLSEKKNKGLFRKFISQFDNAMILILVFSAVVSFFLALDSGDGKEFIEPVVILFIVFLNASLGALQESKAEKTLEELKKMSASHCMVVRSGKKLELEVEYLVPGDIVLLEAGDIVPADCRVIEQTSLKVDESFLTGESEAVEKNEVTIYGDVHSAGDIKNMLFSGSSILMGKCKAIVCETGMNTKIGNIASSLKEINDNKDPIEKKLEVLSKYIGICALILCIIIFILGLFNGINPVDMFMISISLAVAAIPEGLPALVTIVFALGVQKMAKRNAIIRKLPAVETLGGASVICTDKTGTLTQNKLSLVELSIDKRKGINNVLDNSQRDLLKYASMCTSLFFNGSEYIGDPLDKELKEWANKKLGDLNYRLIHEFPFDSNRKRMSVIVEYNNEKYVITKGAFESIKQISKVVLENDDNLNKEMSKSGLRVIGVSVKKIDSITLLNDEYIERDMDFIGLIGFQDLPREGIKKSVRICKEAGIKPVMITGDYILTAVAIAKDIGIFENDDIAISGENLHKMDDKQLFDNIENISVYARVNPEDKIRIVKMWQQKGKVVAMTGDGVNDAPALNAADIGCAMGKSGTEVAKNAASLVLVDDNFTTIVDSVREGRNIYENVKKAILFLLGTNMGEIFTMFFAMLFWQVSPLVSMQLLWVNLVTDIAPALALGLEKADEDIMKKQPRESSEKLLSFNQLLRLILLGIFFSFLVLTAYYIGNKNSVTEGRTMAFLVISLSQLFHAFNMRSDKSIFKVGFFSNKYLVIGTIFSLILTIMVCVLEPFKTIFQLASLSFENYIFCFCLALLPILVFEIKKA